eukprot:scaffold1699_cov252-Ochromonas_danica.AAC.9
MVVCRDLLGHPVAVTLQVRLQNSPPLSLNLLKGLSYDIWQMHSANGLLRSYSSGTGALYAALLLGDRLHLPQPLGVLLQLIPPLAPHLNSVLHKFLSE